MWIVWASLALAVLAVIYLAVSGLLIFKATKPSMKKMSNIMAHLQERVNTIMKEKDELLGHATTLQKEVQEKKQGARALVADGKQGVAAVKTLSNQATQAPNPQRIEPVEKSPEVQDIVDRIFRLRERWQRWFGRS